MKYRYFRRCDVLLLLAAVLLAGILWFCFSHRDPGSVAVVEQDGEEVLRLELESLEGAQEKTFTSNGVTLQILFEPDGVQVRSSDCADQICVQTGKLTRAGESAVCLPARISVTLLSQSEESWDAITG